MNNWHSEHTNELCEALLALRTEEECYAFLEDLCTVKEVLELSQRLSVAKKLRSGESYSAIGAATGASSATISRVRRSLEYGSGGYDTVLDRLGGTT